MAKLRSSIPLDDAAARHAAGESLRSLAAVYGVTVPTLGRHLRRAGYKVRSRAEATALENKKGNKPTPKPWNGGHDATVRRMRAEKIQRVQGYRNAKGCEDCGASHPAVLDLHHRPGEEKHKRLKPSGKTRGSGKGWSYMSFIDIEQELQKCIVLCSNCHRIRHYNEQVLRVSSP